MELKVTNELKHISEPIQLNNNLSENEKIKLAEAAKGFESMLTAMMLKSMDSTQQGGMFGENSYGGDYFDSIFQNEIAQYMSSGKGMGVADIIYKKMTGESIPEEYKNIKLTMPGNASNNSVTNKVLDTSSKTIQKISSDKVDIKLNNTRNIPSIQPSSKSLNRLDKYEDIVNDTAKNYGIDPNLIKSVILTESAGNEKAYSKCHAKGLMQLQDKTAKNLGVKNVWNAKENIEGGTKYLSQLLRQYNGDVKLALAGYNAGPGSVNKYNGVPPYKETKNYITRVLGYYNNLTGKSDDTETFE